MNITSQNELNAELSKYPWHDSFVREVCISSPSYVIADQRAVVAPDALWTARILICSADPAHPGIEFIFEGVEDFALSSTLELAPRGWITDDGATLLMTTADQQPIRARSVRIRHMGVDAWGKATHYSAENVFDENGFSNLPSDAHDGR